MENSSAQKSAWNHKMLIIGHPKIFSKDFFKVESAENIKKTTPNSVVVFDFNDTAFDIAHYCAKNSVEFGIHCKTLLEILYAINLRAKYLLVSKELMRLAQKNAEEYLFDAKILVQIDTEEEIEEIAAFFIDGVIFKNYITQLND